MGVPRTEDVGRALRRAADYAKNVGADMLACLGDLADPDSGGATSATQAVYAEVAYDLARSGIASIVIAGNHDVWEDGSGRTTLTPLVPAEEHFRFLYVVEEPRVISLGDDDGNVSFLCLPYAPASRNYDPRAFAAREMATLTGRVVVLGHLMLPGIVPGEETLEMARGRDMAFPIEETTGAALRLNGHYHKRQVTKDGIQIPGSLVRLSFGEEANEPCFLDVTV